MFVFLQKVNRILRETESLSLRSISIKNNSRRRSLLPLNNALCDNSTVFFRKHLNFGNNIVDSSKSQVVESNCETTIYDLKTRLGAYLFRENAFRPNGLIGAMTLDLLDAYFDASGKSSSVRDKLITVNGCLSTPAKWSEFDTEWQAALKDFGFKPDKETGRYVFHATDFHSGYCKFMPTGLSSAQKRAMYDDLIRIIRKHSLYIVGNAVALKDYAKFKSEYPLITKHRLGKAGTFVSVLGIGKCMEWAEQKGYSKSISLIFDRGDEFWGEMYHDFKAFVKKPENKHLNPDSLTDGNKAIFSPIQAADVVAWECRKHFNRFANIKIDVAGNTPHRELTMLREPHSTFALYQYDDIKRRVFEIFPEINGDIAGLEERFGQAVERRDNRLQLKKERKKRDRKIQNKDYEKES